MQIFLKLFKIMGKFDIMQKIEKKVMNLDNMLSKLDKNIIFYTTDDGQVRIEVRLEDENVWLTQNAMAELFETTKQNISRAYTKYN